MSIHLYTTFILILFFNYIPSTHCGAIIPVATTCTHISSNTCHIILTQTRSSSDDIECDNNYSNCIISCDNAKDSCMNSIWCPENGNNCTINCNGDKSCESGFTLQSQNTSNIQLNIHSTIGNDGALLIISPHHGSIDINVLSDAELHHLKLIGQPTTQNIDINCSIAAQCESISISADQIQGDFTFICGANTICSYNTFSLQSIAGNVNVQCINGICNNIRIDARSSQTELNFHCNQTDILSSGTCDSATIYCPDNTCNIWCDLCSNMNVYSYQGINDVNWYCDGDDPNSCKGSQLFCGINQNEYEVELIYDTVTSEWIYTPLSSPCTTISTLNPTILRRTNHPTLMPTRFPSFVSSEGVSTDNPTTTITKEFVTVRPTMIPSKEPTQTPSTTPSPITNDPTKYPSNNPSKSPSENPTLTPSKNPTASPTKYPSQQPTVSPSNIPSISPTNDPSKSPTDIPSSAPSNNPSETPTSQATANPTKFPSFVPSEAISTDTPTTNSYAPTVTTSLPTYISTIYPTIQPTTAPTLNPSKVPTTATQNPSESSTSPTLYTTSKLPSVAPFETVTTENPTTATTMTSTENPANKPTITPTKSPSKKPTKLPSVDPTRSSTTKQPTTPNPTINPTEAPPIQITAASTTNIQTELPTYNPTPSPTNNPTLSSTYTSSESTTDSSIVSSYAPTGMYTKQSSTTTATPQTESTFFLKATMDTASLESVKSDKAEISNSTTVYLVFVSVAFGILVCCCFPLCCIVVYRLHNKKKDVVEELPEIMKFPSKSIKTVSADSDISRRSVTSRYRVDLRANPRLTIMNVNKMRNLVKSNDDAKEFEIVFSEDPDTANIRNWLNHRVELPQYINIFIKNGYNDLNMIQQIESIQELKNIGIKNKEHQRKIMYKINILKTAITPLFPMDNGSDDDIIKTDKETVGNDNIALDEFIIDDVDDYDDYDDESIMAGTYKKTLGYDLKLENDTRLQLENNDTAQLTEIYSDLIEEAQDVNIDINTMQNDNNYSNYTEIERWLKFEVGLPEYDEILIRNGYDSMDIIKEITDKSELQDIGIWNIQHQIQIMSAIRNLKSPQNNNNNNNNNNRLGYDLNDNMRPKLKNNDTEQLEVIYNDIIIEESHDFGNTDIVEMDFHHINTAENGEIDTNIKPHHQIQLTNLADEGYGNNGSVFNMNNINLNIIQNSPKIVLNMRTDQ